MSAQPSFTDVALNDALGTKPPLAAFDRMHRVKLISEVADALLEGRAPTREAALFLAGALRGWLEAGGSLERTFLGVTKPKSHRTPSRLWHELQAAHHDERRDADASACCDDSIEECAHAIRIKST